ncbi:MAG TPA: TonB-dependent receptor [Terriglobales bacterium]|nr:TonB-dependent receptor [Terriglobales bacterium]
MTTKICLILTLSAVSLCAQSNSGELRLKVTDPAGLGVKSSVQLISEVNQVRKTLVTDEAGNLTAKLLPFGLYRLEVRREGFAPFSNSIEIRSAVPADYHVTLRIAPLSTSLTVNDRETLIDPHRSGTINRIGKETIEDRVTSLPGRSLQDLVNSQPGWVYEGNAVLHPRGSEYQTQIVIDGIPLTDNRSPSYGPEIEAEDVQSMSIYTAGIPAEYGRKMGGVVEMVTAKDSRPGLHGEAELAGGSFAAADGYLLTQYGWGKNTLAVSAQGASTDRYLNPPVLQNFTNNGSSGDFGASYERDFSNHDRLGFSVRHEFTRFLVPNEQVQEAAGQRQDRNNFETMGIASYQHLFSPSIVGDFHGMVRDDSQGLSLNPLSTPLIAFQENGFREGYFKGTISIHHGNQEWKAGIESDSTFLREHFSDMITDFTQFDPATPATFNFAENRRSLEQSAFLQDLIRFGKWTVSAGLRWDHYQLLVNQNAVSPRLGVSRYFHLADLVLHASYDRVFQTPDFENILLSSSPEVISLNPQVLRLPVEPSHGNYYEVGFTKGLFQKVRLDINGFDRSVNNFADDDQFLDTAVSFPIAFRKANIYGAEGKLDIPHWGRLSGFVSYSYMVGAAYLPVTGGLFLGEEASNALSQARGRFWVTQDQRNTVRTRFRYQLVERVWAALGAEYGSGLPVEFDGTEQQAVAQFGQAVVNRVNLAVGRVRPSLSIDASAGADLWKKDKRNVRLQADVQNLNNRLNLINFAGLFSGNSIAPPRSYALRLTTAF